MGAADLKIDESKLLTRLDEAAERAHDNLRAYIEEVRREVKEAAAALRDLPDAPTLLRDALAVGAHTFDPTHWGGWYDGSTTVRVNFGPHSADVVAVNLSRQTGPLRVVVVVLPGKAIR